MTTIKFEFNVPFGPDDLDPSTVVDSNGTPVFRAENDLLAHALAELLNDLTGQADIKDISFEFELEDDPVAALIAGPREYVIERVG